MLERRTMIYHIVKEQDYLRQVTANSYSPANFFNDGFVHCAFEVSVIAVANDYYANSQDNLLLLKIDPAKLTSETRYESAVPDKEASLRHLATSSVFPHVYGVIDNSAVEGIGVLQKEKGGYGWPMGFVPLAKYLSGKKQGPDNLR
jgi:uncharacterized protein (DUF952 family)